MYKKAYLDISISMPTAMSFWYSVRLAITIKSTPRWYYQTTHVLGMFSSSLHSNTPPHLAISNMCVGEIWRHYLNDGWKWNFFQFCCNVCDHWVVVQSLSLHLLVRQSFNGDWRFLYTCTHTHTALAGGGLECLLRIVLLLFFFSSTIFFRSVLL